MSNENIDWRVTATIRTGALSHQQFNVTGHGRTLKDALGQVEGQASILRQQHLSNARDLALASDEALEVRRAL